MKIQETRSEFREAIEDFITRKKTSNEVLLVGLYTGSGKTHGVRQALESLKPTFIYLSPRHEVIVDNFWDHGFAFPHLMSRGRFLDKEKTTPYCLLARKDPHIKDLLARGKIDISSRCNGCDYYGTCDYWKTRHIVEMTDTSWMGVHAHISSYLPKHFEERGRETYDLIVIDENPFMSLFAEEMIHDPRVTRRIEDILVYNEIEAGFMFEALKGIRMMLVNGPHEGYFIKALELASKENTTDFLGEYNEAVIKARNLTHVPPYSLVSLLASLFQKYTTLDEILTRIRVDTHHQRKVRIMDYHGDALRNIGLPMMILDATANISIWKKLLGGNSVFLPPLIDKWRYRNVTHLKGGGEFYKTTWERKLAREKCLGYDIVKRICLLSHNGVLMTGHKAILKKILGKLESDGVTNANAIWHYGLTSDNNYWEACDTVVVTSKPVLPPVARKMYADLTGLSDGDLDYIFTESEIVQAIGRVRQALYETSPKLPEGKLVGKKVTRNREKVNVVIFPELSSSNPFNDPEMFSPYHYFRISPFSYYKDILGKGYISVFDCKVDHFKKMLDGGPVKKSKLREGYPFKDFDVIFGYLLMNHRIKNTRNGYTWIKDS